MLNNLTDMGENTKIVQHYTALAGNYNEVWYLMDGYRQWVVDWIIQDLDLQKDDILVDLGGGTGIAAEMIYEHAHLRNQIFCVDCCQDMLDEARHRPGISPLCSDALSFIQRDDIPYNKLLVKGAIHHFSDRVTIFTGIYRQLPSEGRMLILTRPSRTEFPFFEAAQIEFARSQPHYSVFQEELERAGFEVEVLVRAYPLAFSKAHWFRMLEQRFMSHLSLFSDEQIQAGLDELEGQYKGIETFHFSDNLVFITCKKIY